MSYQRGDRVRHREWGLGEVRMIDRRGTWVLWEGHEHLLLVEASELRPETLASPLERWAETWGSQEG